jgi:transcription initiation factor TFIID subunit TAF12
MTGKLREPVELTPLQQDHLQRCINLQDHYGEPYPARTPEVVEIMEQLFQYGYVAHTRYQREDAYYATQAGRNKLR